MHGAAGAAIAAVITNAPDRSARSAIRDLRDGIQRWRLWWLLATGDVKQRYRRSKLGQLWLTISMGVMIFALGLVYPLIFGVAVADYLPYVAASYVIWNFVSGLLNEGCGAFIAATPFLNETAEARSIYVYRVLARNVLVLLHNALVIFIVFALFGTSLHWVAFLSLVGVLLLLLAAGFSGLLLGTLCARFRDLPQIVASLLQVAFFATPIMWKREMLPTERHWIIDWNPFAAFVATIRDPLIGNVPSAGTWLFAALCTIGLGVIAVPFFTHYRARIVYWL